MQPGAPVVMLFAALAGGPLSAQPRQSRHPLDPLSAAELHRAKQILQDSHAAGPDTRYAFLSLHEPEKSAVTAALAAGPATRMADAIMFDWSSFIASRATVDLERGTLVRAETLAVHQPPTTSLILLRVAEAVHDDPRWRAALAARGLRLGRVTPFPVPLGEDDTLAVSDGIRVSHIVAYDHDAPPEDVVFGITGKVDLTHARVLTLTDAGASHQPRLDSAAAAALKRSLPAVATPSMPRTFTRRGSEIRWDHWRIHAGFHPRRGLELYDIAWIDDGQPRPVLYRASVSEMIAPYGDPLFTPWYPRDEGDIGLGHYSRSSIVPLADAPSGADFIDGVVHDSKGDPLPVPRAIAVYERDAGVLWRHAQRSRRARQLVVTSMATVDNYDYAFEWIFGMDGTIEVEVRLTGVMNLRAAPFTRDTAHHVEGMFGHLVSPRVFAPNHQHFFSYRLDFDVDGPGHNNVVEVWSTPEPVDSTNPKGLWFRMRERVLARETEAERDLDAATSRRWRVVSTTATNALGQSTGYALLPGENSLSLSGAGSRVRAKAGWLAHQIWVTPFAPSEMHAGGDYQRLERPGDGLPTWTRADRPLQDTDVVVWYIFGITHLPRPEDYPIMPAYRAGFRLVPSGFFARNPALDAPHPRVQAEP
jgi:primary-amine oxidase